MRKANAERIQNRPTRGSVRWDSDQDPIAMVDLVLDDLRCPAGKGLDAQLAVHGLVLHLDALPALCFPHTFQRKTALFGFVLAGLFQDDRVEQH